MGLQSLQNNYLVSEFGKAFISSKEQLNKKINNKNEPLKPKNDLSEPIQIFKKIANADKKAISSSTKLLNHSTNISINNNNNNYIIISSKFLNSVYDGYYWNIDKYQQAYDSDISIASIYSQLHLPQDIKKPNELIPFPQSNIHFGKDKPESFFVQIEWVPVPYHDQVPKMKRLFFRKSISYKYITFKSIDNLKCFDIPMEELLKISKPTSCKSFPSTGLSL